MASSPKSPDRDPKDRAEARRWATEMRRRGEAGELTDDVAYLKRRLAEEKRKQQDR